MNNEYLNKLYINIYLLYKVITAGIQSKIFYYYIV